MLFVAALALASCSERPAGTRVDLDKRVDVAPVRSLAAAHTAGLPGVPLHVAVASVLSPTRTLEGYHDLMTYMGERLHRPVHLVQRNSYAEINELLRIKDIDLAFVCAGALVEGERSFGMETLAVPQVAGQTVYYSYLIVHRDSAAKTLDDLHQRTFAFSDPLSNTGRLVPTYQLAIRGASPETFFARHVFTYSHDNSIVAVADRLADAAAVDSLVYDYLAARHPDAVAQTRIIARWGPYGIPPIAVHPAMPAEEKRHIKTLLLSMHEDPAGAAILKGLLIDRFVAVPPALFQPVRDMAARLARR